MGIAGFMGMKYAGGTLDTGKISAIQALLSAEFTISPLAFIPPVLVIGLAASKKPAIPSIFAGVLAGCLLAAMHGVGFGELLEAMQNGYVPALSGDLAGAVRDIAAQAGMEGAGDAKLAEIAAFLAANPVDMSEIASLLASNGVTAVTPDAAAEASVVLTELLERGGLQSMNWTVSLILCALTFGGVLERVGYLEVVLNTCMKWVKSPGALCTSVIISCFVTNFLTGDQYISLVLPGRMMKEKFDESGLHPRMLSRSLEDSGTLTSVLIPWNTCGAYHWKTLGVHPFEYAPYAFLNWLNPVIAIIMTYMGIGIAWRAKGGGFVISRTKPAVDVGPE
jgi:NhaC family Na+:H+ antiporter